MQMMDENGNIVNRYSYDEWGNILEKQETIENPIRYAGEYYDEESGLYYLRARYYDPVIGRFITKDSYEGQLTNPLTLNQYTYCYNNPLAYVDPDGHVAIPAAVYLYLSALGTSPDTQVDMKMLADSWTSFKGDPSVLNGIATALDAGALALPVVPAGGGKIVDDVVKASKRLFNIDLQMFAKGAGKFVKPDMLIDSAQFGKKVGKHAQDFGLNPALQSSRDFVRSHIDDIYNNAEEIRTGMWRGLGEVMKNGNRADGMANFFRKGNDVVVTDTAGNFVTILKDGATQNTRFKGAEIIFGGN